jgi:predicted secreted hydrolase
MRLPALPRPLAVIALLGAVAGLAGLLALAAWRLGSAAAPPGGAVAASWQVAAALSAPAAGGFARALAPRPFSFPADHGPHPGFRTEWWYYTGNLWARDGRRFGFQLTFFRVGLAPPETATATGLPARGPARTSSWATREVYFAHFAITDVAARRFTASEHWERGAAGLAGARAEPFRVWVGDWSATEAATGAAPGAPAGAATGNAGDTAGATATGTPPMHLSARAGAQALDLLLTGALPPVLEGDHGLSAKGAEPGNASYYYSLPRLTATGTLRLGGGETIAVHGSAWMDREWSTSSLDAGETGWDWFALQLDDGWELMLYRLRRRAGAGLVDPASRATLIAPDGHATVLPPAAWRLAATAFWTSPATGIRYPSAWSLSLPAAGPPLLSLTAQPVLPDQELALSFRYWEGAVDLRGTHAGRPVAGHGYVELTGYR